MHHAHLKKQHCFAKAGQQHSQLMYVYIGGSHPPAYVMRAYGPCTPPDAPSRRPFGTVLNNTCQDM